MTKCVAILGANGVGKSTLAQRLAGLEGGRMPAPQPHEIAVAEFSFLGDSWTVLDCPGSLEFMQQSMDALLVADIAVICVSPDPETAVLSAPFVRLAEQAQVPTLLFINRVDEATSPARDIVAALQGYSKHPIVLRQMPIREDGRIVGAVDLVSERAWKYREGEPSELIEIPAEMTDDESERRGELLESLSEYDDWLLEELIEDRAPASGAIYGICSRVLAEGRVVEAFIGSAERSNGVFRLMKALRHEAPDLDALRARSGDGAMAASFLARHRRHVGKTVYLRAFDGLKTGDRVGGGVLGPLQTPKGDKWEQAAAVAPGQVFSAIKSDHLQGGRIYGAEELPAPDWYRSLPPLLRIGIMPLNDRDDAKLSEAIGKVVSEDPSLTAEHDTESGAHILAGQGALHLRRARETIAEAFGVETVERAVTPPLRETISKPVDIHYRHKKQTGGAGQFADVKIKVTPLSRGEGFQFEQTIHGGSVPRNFIPAVEAGAKDATDRGPLGFPVVDIAVNLHDGQYHSVDSSDMAFRIAARGGVRQALDEAGAVLLEPIHEVRFMVPSVFTGALNPMVSSRRGQVLGFDRVADAEGWDEFRALLPGTALEDLIADLRSITQGVGRYEAVFHHYQELYGRDAETMIQSRAKALAPA
ncbi:MAG TPA: elongation factor G [Paracoccaceae bacterium]|nr:elongation factor G [Paracoccaceae bacterium]